MSPVFCSLLALCSSGEWSVALVVLDGCCPIVASRLPFQLTVSCLVSSARTAVLVDTWAPGFVLLFFSCSLAVVAAHVGAGGLVLRGRARVRLMVGTANR